MIRNLMQQISRLPWAFIAAFNLAAITAFVLMIALSMQNRGQSEAGTPTGITTADNAANEKRIAFSFDDSPRGAGAFIDVKKRPGILLKALKSGGVEQAVFFVNPGRINLASGHDKMLSKYSAAGHVLANHTANHLKLSDVSAQKFLADVDLAERWLKGKKGYRPWLRFPHLDQGGEDLAKRDAVHAGMKRRGLTHGYITIDASDWFLEGRALSAEKNGRKINRTALRDLYVETHVNSANFSHRLARRVLGRAPVQMLLLHDNDLAAMYVGDLARALRDDGWTIVSADEAYKDPMAKLNPKTEFAGGNMLQLLAWERGVDGSRWYKGNDTAHITKIFSQRVLQQ